MSYNLFVARTCQDWVSRGLVDSATVDIQPRTELPSFRIRCDVDFEAQTGTGFIGKLSIHVKHYSRYFLTHWIFFYYFCQCENGIRCVTVVLSSLSHRPTTELLYFCEGHNREGRHLVEGFEGAGEYSADLTYTDIDGNSLMLEAVILYADLSSNCSQYIR